MRTNHLFHVAFALMFASRINHVSGSGTSVNVGKTYVVPPPSELPNLVDYTNLTQQCSQSTSSPSCVWAMNQFISDLNLMLPDTKTFISNLVQQITTDQNQAQYKSTHIQSLIATVNTLSSQLIQNAATLDAADDSYYSNLGTLQSLVAATVNQQTSPVYAMANAEASSMTTRLNALQAAVSSYLAEERSAITSTANYVYQLFKNDQGIIQNDAQAQMKTISGQATNLTHLIGELRSEYQGNVSLQTTNLNTQNQQLIQAEASADAAVTAAERSIASTIQAGLSSAMESTTSVLNSQVANVSSSIDSLRTDSYTQFDSAFNAITASNANATAQIEANISSAQASINTLNNLVAVNVQAAHASQQSALRNLNSTQTSQQARLAQNAQTLNQSVSDYTAKAASVTNSVFGSSQQFMAQFAGLAQSAAAQAGGSMAGSATSTGDSMSSLNSYIGSMSGSAYAQSQGAAADMADAISNTRQSAAMTSVQQLKALSDAINTISTLVALLKAKLGYSSDQNGVQASSIQQLVNATATDLQQTINSVSNSIAGQTYASAQTAQAELNKAGNAVAEGKQRVLKKFNEILNSVQSRISQVAVKRTNAVTTGQNIASGLGSIASKLANSNLNLSNQIAALIANINSSWATVSDSNSNLSQAVAASLNQLTNAASELGKNQTANSLQYISDQLTSFKALVHQTQISALAAEATSVDVANRTMQSLASEMNNTLASSYKVVNSTMFAANVTLGAIKQIPSVLIGLAASGASKIDQAAANATVTMESRVDQVKAALLSQISETTSRYLNNGYAQISPVTEALNRLQSQLVAERQLQQAVFPEGMDLLNMNSSEFASTLAKASLSVSNASSSLGDIYNDLASNLSSTYGELSAGIDSVHQRSSTLEPNVSAAVEQALVSAQANISSTQGMFLDFGSDLVKKVIAKGAMQVQSERDLTAKDFALFKSIIDSAVNKTTATMAQVSNATAVQQANQAAVASALDQIVHTLSTVSGGNTKLLLDIQGQFNKLQSSTSGLGNSLNTSLSTALVSASSAAADSERNAQNSIQATAGQSAAQMADLGDRLRNALAAINSGSAMDISSLSQSDAQAMELAKTVEALGTNTSSRIHTVLSQILSGQSSVSDVLNASANLQIANLNSAEDVIVAFTHSVNDFMSQTQVMYQTQDDKLSAFNATVPAVLAKYHQERALALASSQSVIKEANATAFSYNKTEQNLISDTSAAITQANYQLGNMTVEIPAQISAIKQAIQKAVLAVEDSQDSVGTSLIKATQSAKANIVGKLRSFRTQKHMPSYSLSVEDVNLPTPAPLIAINV